MALQKTEVVPESVLNACAEGVKELEELGRVEQDLPLAGSPQEIYTLDGRSLIDGWGLKRAKRMAWQFLLGSATGPAAAAYVSQTAPAKRPRMTSLSHGRAIAHTIRSTLDLENMPEVRSHDYELRKLWIAAALVKSFWLKSLDGGNDLAVPYHAQHEQFELMRTYPMDEFLEIAGRIAERRLKLESRLRRKR